MESNTPLIELGSRPEPSQPDTVLDGSGLGGPPHLTLCLLTSPAEELQAVPVMSDTMSQG